MDTAQALHRSSVQGLPPNVGSNSFGAAAGPASIGILDATNSTRGRRERILAYVAARAPQVHVVFVESICQDPTVLHENLQMKLSSPDYVGMPQEQALRDFEERLRLYTKNYESIDEEEELATNLSYIKLIDGLR